MLQGKRAVVTGSTSGIGLGIARSLAESGADVMLNGFGDADEIERQRADIATTFGVRALYHGADMSDGDQIADLVATAERDFGAVDILVNNAGIQHTAPVDDFPVDRWNAIIAINLSAAFHAIRAVLPGMKSRGWGRIVNTASVHGLVASVEKAAYVAAKHGIVGLTKVVALETAGSGITCNAFAPGWVRTPLVERQIEARSEAEGTTVEEAARRLLSEKQPSGQFVTIDNVTSLVRFLCSPAADQITGSTMTMDGGWTAQ